MDYQRYFRYLEEKIKKRKKGTLYDPLFDEFKNHTPLAIEMFGELTAGKLTPNSGGGSGFYFMYRRSVSTCTTMNKFIVRLQKDFNNLEAALKNG